MASSSSTPRADVQKLARDAPKRSPTKSECAIASGVELSVRPSSFGALSASASGSGISATTTATKKRLGPGAVALNMFRRKGDLHNFFFSRHSSGSQKSAVGASAATQTKETSITPTNASMLNFSSGSSETSTSQGTMTPLAKPAHSNSTSSTVTLDEESTDVFASVPPHGAGKRGTCGASGLRVLRRETGSDASHYYQHAMRGEASSSIAATPTGAHRSMTASSSITGGLSGSGATHSHLLAAAHGAHGRRESFLYRGVDEREPFYNIAPLLSAFRPVSRASSVASSDPQHGDDFIVTPFAQLLASLRNVRANLAAIANLPPSTAATVAAAAQQMHTSPASSATSALSQRRSNNSGSGYVSPLWQQSSSSAASGALPEPVQQCTLETLDELDWCLDQLEAIQTHRSVTEMASSKFRKLLNKELSQFAESSKSGTQISKYLINTYMEDRNDEEEGRNAVGSLRGPDATQLQRLQQKRHSHFPGAVSDCSPSTSTASLGGGTVAIGSPQPSLFNKAKTAAMSKISGVRRLRTGLSYISGAEPPEYGVHCQKEIQVYMQAIHTWGLNVFKVHELSKQHSLTAITYTLLRERKSLELFDIPSGILITYLLHLEHHYKPNPYHNQIHAADVAQSINVLISSPALEGVFSDLEVLAAIVAAAIHDVDHPGYTNQYLINTNSELAIMYNDESVLEQHHLAVAFKLLQEPHCDFLVGLTKKQRQTFRKIVIEMVLATDMSKHMTLLADLKTMVEAKKVSSSSVVMLDKYNDRIQVLQSMIHLADLSNPTKPIEIYRKWNERILEEYWRQGDKEKEQNLEVSPMCDRGNVTIEKSQVGFIDYIVHPLFETWAELVYPDAQPILDQLEDNRQWYLARIDPEDRPPEPNIMESLTSSAISSAVMSRKRFVPADVSTSSNDGGGCGVLRSAGDDNTDATIAAVAKALVTAPTSQGHSRESVSSIHN